MFCFGCVGMVVRCCCLIFLYGVLICLVWFCGCRMCGWFWVCWWCLWLVWCCWLILVVGCGVGMDVYRCFGVVCLVGLIVLLCVWCVGWLLCGLLGICCGWWLCYGLELFLWGFLCLLIFWLLFFGSLYGVVGNVFGCCFMCLLFGVMLVFCVSRCVVIFVFMCGCR